MMHTHDTPPGEARTDVTVEGLMFKWMRATVTMMRIKAVWAVEASPAIEEMERHLDSLPEGEERLRVIAALEERYSAFVCLWLRGFTPIDDATAGGPEPGEG